MSSRESLQAVIKTAAVLGDVTRLIHAGGGLARPGVAGDDLKVYLYGTAVLLEESGNVMAPGGWGVVIASHSGHRRGERGPERER